MGHRSRQMERLLSQENISDLDLIEMMLFLVIPRHNTRELAARLKHNSNGLIDLFSNIDQQDTTDNVKSIFHLVYYIAQRIQKEKIVHKYISDNMSDLLGYLKIVLGEKSHEEFWCVFINDKQQVEKIEMLFSGGTQDVHIYQNQIFKKCILYDLYKIILVHNHPSKDPTPSTQDLQLTKNLQQSAKIIDIVILDHIIIGGNNYYSFKQNGLITAQ